MASVQERLQLKRMPLENWSINEQLYLASAVACSGDQNWMSVSRQLKSVCGNNRPSDWFSQKSCAAQYEMLLENVEPTKRKKRNEKDTGQTIVETPIELIVRKLTQERIVELNKMIQEEREEFQKLRNEIAGIQSNAFDENQLREMLLHIENEEKQRERKQQKYAQWLKVTNILNLLNGYDFRLIKMCFCVVIVRNVKRINVKWKEHNGRKMRTHIRVHRPIFIHRLWHSI